jgi:integrase
MEMGQPPTLTLTVMGFREAAYEYLDFAKRKFGSKTYEFKAYVYKRLLEEIGDLPITEITVQILEKYLGTRQSNTNYNRHRRELCALLRWAWRKRGYLTYDICCNLEKMGEPFYTPRVYTQEEALKILLCAHNLKVYFLALYALAGRMGEVSNLRWQDVDFTRRQVTLWTKKRTGEWRAQKKPMNRELFEELTRLYGKKSGEWVFPNPETGEPYKDRRRQIHRVCKAAGVPYKGFHALRHSASCLLIDREKISLPTLQKMLGHTDIVTTQKYARALGHDEIEAAEFLSTKNLESHANSHANDQDANFSDAPTS